jgi:2,3-bisphosphoglycerate-independent phosphoglycerate mutase
MAVEDKALRHTVEREVSKLTGGIDVSLMSVMVVNGVVYLGGRVRPLKGAAGRGVDLKRQVAIVREQLATIRGVTQVVFDATIENA